MKKLFLSVVLITFILSCSNEESSFDNLSIIKQELKTIAIKEPTITAEFFGCNINNPYDEWGNELYYGLEKIFDVESKMEKKNNNEPFDLQKSLSIIIDEKFLVIDTVGVNINFVSEVFNEFLNIYTEMELTSAIEISKSMENYILNSNLIEDANKIYLLKLASVVRFCSFYVISNQTKGPFEDCWTAGLATIEDSGWATRLLCLADWPMCFGAILIDCGIEQLN